MDYTVLNTDDLPHDGSSYEFEGYLYGDTGISLIGIDLPPGGGPRLHQHPYAEVFIVQEGQATYTLGTTTREVQAGQIVIAPPGVPHKFTNSGTGRLRTSTSTSASSSSPSGWKSEPHFVIATVTPIGWWLDHDMPYPPEHMGPIYAALIVQPTHALAFAG